jgi:hypothetical protein
MSRVVVADSTAEVVNAGRAIRTRRSRVIAAMVNVVDATIVTLFMGIIAAAFFSGVSRVAASIGAVYFGVICATASYHPLTTTVQEFAGIGSSTGDLTFFLLTLFLYSVAFGMVISQWLEGVHLPRRFAVLDNIGGAAVGLAVSGCALGVSAMFLSFLVRALNAVTQNGQGPIVELVDGQMRDSALVPFFLRIAPFFVDLIRPWFPDGLPSLLAGG